MFNSPQEIGDATINAGFDIFNCANNHIMDKGSQGIMNEIEYFKKHKDVVYLGINEDEKSYNTIKYYVKIILHLHCLITLMALTVLTFRVINLGLLI